MKPIRVFSRVRLAGIALYAVLTAAFRSKTDAAKPDASVNTLSLVVKTAFVSIIAFIVLEAIIGLLFAMSGVYQIAADVPHFPPVRWLLETTRTRSVQFHSRGLPARNIRDPRLIAAGFSLYRKNCQPCHGAPGIAGEQIGRGINPVPPPLQTAACDWTDSQLYWIVSRGLKMSGMPAFSPRLSDADRWALVAFVRRMSFLSPADYQQITQRADQGVLGGSNFKLEGDYGFAQLRHGNPVKGRELLRSYGCITCHSVTGIHGSATVGPPLTRFAEREYIAGLLVNLPANTVSWMMNPKQIKANTAMPFLAVTETDAFDMTAYLYTPGSHSRVEVLEQLAARR